MKGTNKIFFLFIFITTLIMTISWEVVQTDTFAQFLSTKIQNLVKKNSNYDISFEGIEVGFFPPVTVLKKVRVTDTLKEIEVLEAQKIGARFGFFDLIAKDFSVNTIFIDGAFFDLDRLWPKEKLKNKRDLEVKDFTKLNLYDLKSKIPFNVKKIVLNNLDIETPYGDMKIPYLETGVFKNILTLQGQLEPSIFFLEKEKNKILDLNQISYNLHITSKGIRVKTLKLEKELDYLELSGFFDLKKKKTENFNLNVQLDLKRLKNYINNPQKLGPVDGLIRARGVVQGSFDKPQLIMDLNILGFDSKWINIDDLAGRIEIKEDVVSLSNAKVKIKKGEVSFNEKTSLYNIRDEKVLLKKVKVQAKRLFTNDILSFLGPSLDIMKFEINGLIDVHFDSNKISLTSGDGVHAKNFRLLKKSGETPILAQPSIEIVENSTVAITKDKGVELDIAVKLHDTYLRGKGNIKKDSLNVEIIDSFINLDSIGAISGVSLKGRGKTKGIFSGHYPDIRLNLMSDLENLSVIGINLGKIKGQTTFSFRDLSLLLKEVKGLSKNTKYQGEGVLRFGKDRGNVDLNIVIKKGEISDLKDIFHGLTQKYNYKGGYLVGPFSGNASVQGGFSSEKLSIEGKFHGKEIGLFRERFEKVNFSYLYSNQALNLKKILINKNEGVITGNLDYNFKSFEYGYKLDFAKISLKDINYYSFLNLGYNGEAYGEVYGEGKGDQLRSRTQVKVTKGTIKNKKVKDSILTIHSNQDDIFSSAKLFGGDFSFDSYINLDKKSKKRSHISSVVKVEDIKVILGSLSKHNVDLNSIQGNLFGELKMSFDFHDYKGFDLHARLDKMFFKKENVFLKVNEEKSVVIENGQVKDWDFVIRGKGASLISNASGSFRDKFNLNNKFEFDGTLFETLSENLFDINGVIRGSSKFIHSNEEEWSFYTDLHSDNLNFRVLNLPGTFQNTAFKVSLNNENFLIEKFQGYYGGGPFSLNGRAKLLFANPNISMKANFERSRVPILDKSNIVLGGNLELKGNKLPYKLRGNISIIHSEILDDINNLVSQAGTVENYERFLPKSYFEGSLNILDTDLFLSILKPIKVKNKLTDIRLRGGMRVFGPIIRPFFNGELSVKKGESKFLFKGHEFKLSEGRISFNDTDRKVSPELNFNGVAKIEDYDVTVNVSGSSENPLYDMRATPPLAKEDILSLLTLGVTSDVSKNLGDRERQSITTLGVGSLIVDQLRINQSLNENLGLKLSVSPDFQDDEESLINDRVGDSSTNSRIKSSTKIRVRKKVSKNVDLSVSSNIGGSIKNKQEMSVDVQFKDGFSLKGIYEIKSTEDINRDNPDSFGIDLIKKFKF